MSATGSPFRPFRAPGRRRRVVAGVAAVAVAALVAALVAAAAPAGASTAAAATTAGTSAMQGQVLSQMDPVVGFVTVTAFDADSGAAVKSVVSDGAGNWHIGGLAAGRYKVRAAKTGYLTSWANGKTSKATADVFTLAPGQTLTQSWDPMVLYLDLLPEAVLQGSVLGINDNPDAGFDDPLPGVTVTAFDADTGVAVRSATTDALGNFRITGLGPDLAGGTGRYKVRAAKTGWITSWANGKTSKATADVFATFPGQVLDVPGLTLYAPAAIQGSVLGISEYTDDPIPGVTVTAFDADTGLAVGSAITTGDHLGNYRIDGLRPGRYKVRAASTGWLTTWANDKTSKATADVFDLYPGQIFDLGLTMYGAAAMQGQVLGDFDPLGGAVVTAFEAVSGTAVKSVLADGSGYWRIDGLLPGSYKVRATKTGWITSWADGARSKDTATVFTLYPGQLLTQSWDPVTLYLDLLPEAVIEGTVLGLSDNPDHSFDDDLQGVTVTAFDASTGAAVRSVTTDATGRYRIGGLLPGSYKVRASLPGWITSWANTKTSKATADVFDLYQGQTLDLHFTLFQTVAMQGQVLGNFDPLGGAVVTAFDAGSGTAVKSVLADGSGYWRIDGLLPGSYKVRATKTGWITSWANGRTSKATADVFTLFSGRVLTQSWDPLVLYLDLAPITAPVS